jgi:hypothetical protein
MHCRLAETAAFGLAMTAADDVIARRLRRSRRRNLAMPATTNNKTLCQIPEIATARLCSPRNDNDLFFSAPLRLCVLCDYFGAI